VLVLARLARGRTPPPALAPGAPRLPGTVSVVVPARDEEARLPACLAPLAGQADEIVVVDDQSSDDTARVAASFGARVVRGAPLPRGWAGKAWALEQGLRAATGDRVVFLDADTRPRAGLVRALVEASASVDLLSAGPRFEVHGAGERWLHPALLASLVYRFGPLPPRRPLANGQCLVARRAVLLEAGGWARVRGHLVEDIALARAWARDGRRLGFVDAADLLEVRMYDGARATWSGWGRSLSGGDALPAAERWFDVGTVWLALVLPQARLLLGRADAIDRVLLALRLAVLAGTARSYTRRGPPFWLSPLADAAAAVRLTLPAGRTWRGRSYPSSRSS